MVWVLGLVFGLLSYVGWLLRWDGVVVHSLGAVSAAYFLIGFWNLLPVSLPKAMGRKMYWHCKEFREGIGVVPSLHRELMMREKVLPFLNERKLDPRECYITCHVDYDPFDKGRGLPREPQVVYQVFYRSDFELM